MFGSGGKADEVGAKEERGRRVQRGRIIVAPGVSHIAVHSPRGAR
jgi:hypothetical protein